MFFHSTNLQISLAMMLRFQNRLKLVNREIETVVLNTLNLIDSKKWVIHGFLIFHEMGNPLGVYETNYKVKFVKNLLLGKIWPPSDLLFLV